MIKLLATLFNDFTQQLCCIGFQVFASFDWIIDYDVFLAADIIRWPLWNIFAIRIPKQIHKSEDFKSRTKQVE